MINRIRGLLSELGIVMSLKANTVRKQAHLVLEDLPGWCNTVIGDLLSHLSKLDDRIAAQGAARLLAGDCGNCSQERPDVLPRWPLQIAPPVAGQIPPGRTAKLSIV